MDMRSDLRDWCVENSRGSMKTMGLRENAPLTPDDCTAGSPKEVDRKEVSLNSAIAFLHKMHREEYGVTIQEGTKINVAANRTKSMK